jgi:predicted GIY-YIG superfamily endonuclease
MGLSGTVRPYEVKLLSRMGQLLLIPDPRPLDERLGRKFFRRAPKRTGVYLMRDAADRVLYVGKARNLQQRLRNYRIANPDRMPRRQLRMVREVARIEFQFCPGESAALRRESKLLRSLRPKFNRAGVWPGKTRFLVWRLSGQKLELAAVEVPETGWRRFGPLGSSVCHLRGSLLRLLWLAMNPDRSFAELPAGWAHGNFPEDTAIDCGPSAAEIAGLLDAFFWESSETLVLWLGSRFTTRIHPFERGVIEAELEALNEFSTKRVQPGNGVRQLALL